MFCRKVVGVLVVGRVGCFKKVAVETSAVSKIILLGNLFDENRDYLEIFFMSHHVADSRGLILMEGLQGVGVALGIIFYFLIGLFNFLGRHIGIIVELDHISRISEGVIVAVETPLAMIFFFKSVDDIKQFLVKFEGTAIVSDLGK